MKSIKNSLTFEQFARELKYDMTKSTPLNKEYKSLKFPHVHTRSKKQFVKYILDSSHYFGEHLSVDLSNSLLNRYTFKCSVKNCGMKVCFHKENDVICLNSKISNFQHNYYYHDINSHGVRMFESTYNDLIERSKHHENINDLIASHEDLEEVPVKTIYNIRTKINK